ncbi:MAG: hypothetical protein ACRDWA_18935 [Acidimicrobiia bacterium]
MIRAIGTTIVTIVDQSVRVSGPDVSMEVITSPFIFASGVEV